MFLYFVIIITFAVTTAVEATVFYWQHRRYQYFYTKEKHSFHVARKISGLLLQTADSTPVTQKLADFLPNELDFATGVIVLYEKEQRDLRRVAASNTKEAIEAIKALRIPFTDIVISVDDPDNLMSRSIREKREFITENVHDVFVPILTQEEAANIQHILGTQSTIIYPMFVGDTPLGVFIASSKKKANELTEYEKDIISVFVDGAGIALQNALYISSIQDITESLKKANIQIGLTGKLKNDLLTMSSHEFRTPTSNIQNMLWALDNDKDLQAKLTEKEKQYFDHLRVSVERLNYVVNNINQMLLATSGNLEENLHFSSVQVEKIMKQVLEDKETAARDALVTLTYQEPPVLLPPVEADPLKLKYVIYELVTNALKYTDKQGSVTLSTGVKDHTVTITIQDTGRGISPERLATLFQEFGKIDPLHTTQAGMGLGLYLVERIIKLHKGQLMVNSTVGKGTVCTIELPAQNITSESSVDEQKSPLSPVLHL